MNHEIIEALTHIADSYRSQGVIYKYKAYRVAIDAIKGLHQTEIRSVDQVRNLPGLGKAMLEKIEEILKTGALKQEQEVMSDPVTKATQLFTSIHGIGPVLAKKLVHEMGLRTLDDLKDHGHILPPQVRLGLKYHDDTSKRVPYDEIEEHLVYVKQLVERSIDRNLQIMVCGSHRRGGATSGDIDMLITHPASGSDSGCEYAFLPEVSRVLREAGYVVDVLAEGSTKFMGYSRLRKNLPVRRLDMRWFPYDQFFTALMYFTGSDMFNVTMRMEALKRGYTINEYGVFEVEGYQHLHDAQHPNGAVKANDAPAAGATKGKKMLICSEKDVFDLLKMKYVPPSERERGLHA